MICLPLHLQTWNINWVPFRSSRNDMCMRTGSFLCLFVYAGSYPLKSCQAMIHWIISWSTGLVSKISCYERQAPDCGSLWQATPNQCYSSRMWQQLWGFPLGRVGLQLNPRAAWHAQLLGTGRALGPAPHPWEAVPFTVCWRIPTRRPGTVRCLMRVRNTWVWTKELQVCLYPPEIISSLGHKHSQRSPTACTLLEITTMYSKWWHSPDGARAPSCPHALYVKPAPVKHLRHCTW